MATCFNTETIKFLRRGNEIFDLMKNIVSYDSNSLRSVSVATCFCFLKSRTFHHVRTESYECFCFECRLKNLLCGILVERNYQRYLFHVTLSSYDEFDDLEILCKILVADM